VLAFIVAVSLVFLNDIAKASVGKDHFENDLKSKSYSWRLISNQNYYFSDKIKITIIKFHKDKYWHNKRRNKSAH